MKNLLKNNFRYILKNKIIMIALFVLLSIAIMIFGAFINLSSNINKVYNNLIQNYNLHNIVINENYSNNSEIANKQREYFKEELKKIDVQFREFNSFNVNNTEKNELIKVIEYLSTYEIDRLNVFEQYGLPKNINYGNYVLPNSIEFEKINELASTNITSNSKQLDNTLARQKIVFFMSRSDFQSSKYQYEINQTWEHIQKNPNYDPLFPDSTANNSLRNVSKYLDAFLNPKNPKYSPLTIRGNRLIINLTQFNNGIPLIGYFQDPYAYIGIISNGYAERNNKKVYSFDEYKQNILYTNKKTQVNSLSLSDNDNNIDLLPNNPSNFPNLKSSKEITTFFDSISDDYKLYVNNIPYLIVGTGITPDFTYPILAFENNIPDPKKEAILYVNKNGYSRVEGSFESSPHESFLLAKYNGPLSKNEILKKINILATKYMSWPSNIIPAYWFNDTSNQLTPSALRVEFINVVISTFISIVFTLTIFILVLVIFAMFLFVKRFISNNKVNIGISISNGISKNNILFSLSFVTTFICLIAGPIGLVMANFLQYAIFKFLNNYWFLPTPIESFHFWWYFFVTIIPMAIFLLLVFIIGYLSLRQPLTSLLKQDINLKINKAYMLYNKLINRTNVLYKFKSSIIFGSFGKIIFITLLSTLSISSITFAATSASQLNNAYNLETKTNNSIYSIDLFTPSKQGGQYFGTSIQNTGHQLKSTNGNIIADGGYQIGLYSNLYKESPIFRNYSALFLASANDSTLQKSDILYTKNKTGIQILLDYFFGIGNLGTNPWNVSKSFLPSNQMYTSNNLTNLLLQKILTDNRPYNQAYFNNIIELNTIQPNEKNSIPFPSKWVIKNFNQLNYASNWELNENNEPEVGIINASEIFKIVDNKAQLRWLKPSDVLQDQKQLASIINSSYNTYGSIIKNDEISDKLEDRLFAKLYPEFLTQEAISNITVKENSVEFNVDIEKNIAKDLITTRSYFLKMFLKKIEINSNDLSIIQKEGLILDPLDKDSYINKKYGYQITNAISLLKMNDDYTKLMFKVYNDPAYLKYFYRILNNFVVLDETTDEPYVYINGTIQNIDGLNKSQGNNIKIIGIKQDSQFINLFDLQNKKINDKLHNENYDFIPIIVNRYTAKKHKLSIGSILNIKTNNQIDRFEYENIDDAKKALKSEITELNLKKGEIQKYKIVDINNTGNGEQLYISLKNAQKIIGLATEDDYIKNENITTIIDGELNVGMNNQWNKTGGFNGIFTKLENPLMLSNTVGVYSSSGLYPGHDSWAPSSEITSLIEKTINNKDKLLYLTNALQLTITEFNNIKNEIIASGLSNKDLVIRIINLLNYKYGSMSFNTIYENAIALSQQKLMFSQLSETFDNIMIAITALLISLSITIIIIISSMIINDLLKFTAILTTLGYSSRKNASLFFAIFIPSWLISVILMIPINIILNSLLHTFIFNTLFLFIEISFNWTAFAITSLVFAGIFGLIFLWGLKWFQKNNIVEALKW